MDKTLSPNLPGGHSDLREYIKHSYSSMAMQHAPMLSLILRFRKLLAYMLVLLIVYCVYCSSALEEAMLPSKLARPAHLGANSTSYTDGDTFSNGSQCISMRFAGSGDNWPRTALVTYPGSDHIWARKGIELLSGIYTGSLYDDRSEDTRHLFPGQGISNSSVFVVSTHWPVDRHTQDMLQYDRIILVYRPPAELIKASFWLSQAGRVNASSSAMLPYWKVFAEKGLREWSNLYNFWLNFTHVQTAKTFILHHDEMRRDLRATSQKLVEFLDLRPSLEQFECAIHNQRVYFPQTTSELLYKDLPTLGTESGVARTIAERIQTCIQSGLCSTSSAQFVAAS